MRGISTRSVTIDSQRKGREVYLVKVFTLAPTSLHHSSGVKHQEINIPNFIFQALPGAQVADVRFDARYVALEVLLCELERLVVVVDDGDFHRGFETELCNCVADA